MTNAKYSMILLLELPPPSPAIEGENSIVGKRVVAVLERRGRTYGLHRVIITDIGTDFTSRAVDEFAHRNGVKLNFIRPEICRKTFRQ